MRPIPTPPHPDPFRNPQWRNPQWRDYQWRDQPDVESRIRRVNASETTMSSAPVMRRVATDRSQGSPLGQLLDTRHGGLHARPELGQASFDDLLGTLRLTGDQHRNP